MALAEGFLNLRGERGIGGCHAEGRGIALGHLARKGRSADGTQARLKAAFAVGEHVGDDLRHAQQGIVFNPLGGGDQQHLRMKQRLHLAPDAARVMRGHDAENDFRAGDGFRQTLRGLNALRQRAAAEKWFVDVIGADGLDHFLFVSPQLELVRAFAGQGDGQRRAPGSGSDDCNSCHENPMPFLRRNGFQCQPKGVRCSDDDG